MKRVWHRIQRSRLNKVTKGIRARFFLSLGIVLTMVLAAILADFLVPYDPLKIDAQARLQPPTDDHYFGTDNLGRDVFSRVIYGTRISLTVGLLAVLIAASIGSVLGVVAGYYGGNVDRVLTLPMDAWNSFPSFLTALLIVVVLGGGLFYTALAIALGLLPGFYRPIRSISISLREEEFISAEIALGASDPYIIFRHIFPLCLPTFVVVMTMSIATSILSIAGLGFLGLGITPPTPEWGADIAAGRVFVLAGKWWLIAGPSIPIFVTVFGFSLFGEAINKVLGTRLEEI
jgi:peptide/nickel transport system permease protein